MMKTLMLRLLLLVDGKNLALVGVKCNVDAAFFVEAEVTTMGACFRDHVGNFVAGSTQRQQATMSTLEDEAWTLLHAMKETNHRGLNRVQFESDSHALTEAIRTRHSGI
ncbi:eukaryotic translation initiation factor 3 subunit C [Trifolium medium]|uniref:Eukaryotic translation initiation factor 3 subunit C n=1 Tax=Trifolium medium TaxID=97028 RepID=A0A392N363_9FABA|nr:eukaryotic translation initiation factor 3 subunit C [Trifolium medium]